MGHTKMIKNEGFEIMISVRRPAFQCINELWTFHELIVDFHDFFVGWVGFVMCGKECVADARCASHLGSGYLQTFEIKVTETQGAEQACIVGRFCLSFQISSCSTQRHVGCHH